MCQNVLTTTERLSWWRRRLNLMSEFVPFFEELDFRRTALGDLSLRRRTEPRAGGVMVYEVKLDDAFLMSSLFTASEESLAHAGLAAIDGDALDVVVGGLGLGFTARSVLAHANVRSLVVVDLLDEVIEWHRRGLVPGGLELAADARCRLVCGDFFAMAQDDADGFDPECADRRFDAILLDVDHSPEHWLELSRGGFYTAAGFRQLARRLTPGGVFGLWSNDGPDAGLLAQLGGGVGTAWSEVVSFDNPYTGGQSACTVYFARKQS